MNHKGDINFPIVMIILFVVVIMLFVCAYVFSKFNDVAQNDSTFKSANESLKNLNYTEQGYRNMDQTILFLFIGFALFMIITSYLIRTNTIFVPFMIILMIIVVILAMVVSNSYSAYAENESDFSTFIQDNYPITNFIFTTLPFLVFIIDIFSLVALFAKKGGQTV